MNRRLKTRIRSRTWQRLHPILISSRSSGEWVVFVQKFCYDGYMTTPVVISQTSLARAAEHAVSDVDAVRSRVRASGVSDREVLEVLEAMLSLQRRVNGTVSVLMAVAEQRNAALRTANTPLESVLALSLIHISEPTRP